jgi:hypothetical protein
MALVSPPSSTYDKTMTAETMMLTSKLHPSSRLKSLPMAYIDTPDEKMVMAANDTAFSVRVFSSNRSRRYSGTERARDP